MSKVNEVKRKIVLEEQHVRRGDMAEQMICSTAFRKKYKEQKNACHDHEEEFQIGNVVVGNSNLKKRAEK